MIVKVIVLKRGKNLSARFQSKKNRVQSERNGCSLLARTNQKASGLVIPGISCRESLVIDKTEMPAKNLQA